MVHTKNDSTQVMIDKLQSLNGKTKIKFYQNIGNFYDEMGYGRSNTFQFKEDVFSKNAKSISKIYHEVLILLEFLQTKPEVKSMNINCYDLYYTVIKNRDVKRL